MKFFFPLDSELFVIFVCLYFIMTYFVEIIFAFKHLFVFYKISYLFNCKYYPLKRLKKSFRYFIANFWKLCAFFVCSSPKNIAVLCAKLLIFCPSKSLLVKFLRQTVSKKEKIWLVSIRERFSTKLRWKGNYTQKKCFLVLLIYWYFGLKWGNLKMHIIY